MGSLQTSGAGPDLEPGGKAGPNDRLHCWTAVCPPIDSGRLLRLHGYTNQQKVRPAIRKAAEAVVVRAQRLVETRACWRRCVVEGLDDGVLRLGGGVTFTCPAFDRLLEGAEEVVAFVLTLGTGFDRAVIDLMERFEPLEALFTETAGRLAIEKLTRMLAADCGAQLASEGLVLGTRLGPGYSYRVSADPGGARVMWPLEQQQELFALFEGATLPVALRHSSVMFPKMSRSGLLAVHRAPTPQ